MSLASRPGFSLIEALIALAIAAMTLTAIFELQIQMTRGQRRAEQVLEIVQIQENAIALTRDINPMLEPSGRVALPDGLRYRWTSVPKGTPIPNVGFPSGNGSYLVQLFTVTVTTERPSGRPVPPLTFDRMGWRSAGDSAV